VESPGYVRNGPSEDTNLYSAQPLVTWDNVEIFPLDIWEPFQATSSGDADAQYAFVTSRMLPLIVYRLHTSGLNVVMSKVWDGGTPQVDLHHSWPSAHIEQPGDSAAAAECE